MKKYFLNFLRFDTFPRCRALEDDEKAFVARKRRHGHERARVLDFFWGRRFIFGEKGIADIFRFAVVVDHAHEIFGGVFFALYPHPLTARKRADKRLIARIFFK